MKEFLKNFAIISAVVVPFLFVMFRNVETVWEPIEKTGGSGTQAVGESDLVLPGGGVEVAMASERDSVEYDTTTESGVSDAEKLALIDAILADAFEYFGELDDSQVWKGVAMCIDNIVEFGGVALG